MKNEVIKNAIRLIQMEIRANAELGNKEHPKAKRQLSDALYLLKMYLDGKEKIKQ